MVSTVLVVWMMWCESLEQSIINFCLGRDGIRENFIDITIF